MHAFALLCRIRQINIGMMTNIPFPFEKIVMAERTNPATVSFPFLEIMQYIEENAKNIIPMFANPDIA